MADRGLALHATHDPVLVAALAAGDVPPTERVQAEALVSGCTECASLHADLLAISTAVRTLPLTEPHAPRDFRLTSEAAERLDRGARIRHFLRPFGGASFGLGRPVGAALATLGLVGILLSAATPSFLGGLAGGAGQELRNTSASPAPAEAPESTMTAVFASSPPDDKSVPGSEADGELSRSGGAAAWLPIGSIVLLASGLALLALRWLGRQAAGP